MEKDKDFMKEAIKSVYKESLLKKNKNLERMAIEAFEKTQLTDTEKELLSNELRNLSNSFRQEEYECYIDGAVDNQSEILRAGIGFAIYIDNKTFYKHQYELAEEYTAKELTQKTSSHIAEYQALISLLRVMSEQILRPENASLIVYSDSEVLVGQYSGEYRVTNPIQKELRKLTYNLSKRFKSVEVEWIPREKNTIANQLAQNSLDSN